MSPHTPLCICCGGCRGPLTCWTPPLYAGHLPLYGDTSPYVLHPPLIGWLPCASVCLGDICMLYGEYSPCVRGFGGIAPYVGVWGYQHICRAFVTGSTSTGCPLCLSCTFFVVHYVSHINHGYDYYSQAGKWRLFFLFSFFKLLNVLVCSIFLLFCLYQVQKRLFLSFFDFFWKYVTFFFFTFFWEELLDSLYTSSYGGVFWSVLYFISDHDPFLDGASCNIRSAWSGSATTPDAEMPWRCYCPCFNATAATSIFDASFGLCQLCYGFSTGRFLFQSWASHHFLYYMFVSILVCFYFQVPSWIPYSPMGAQPLGFAPLQPFGVYPWQAYVQPCDGHGSTLGMHEVAAPSTTLSGGSLLLLSLLLPNHPIHMVGHTTLGAWQRVSWSLHLPYMMGRVFFSRFGSIRWHSQFWICDGC